MPNAASTAGRGDFSRRVSKPFNPPISHQNKIAPPLRCDGAMRREKMQTVGFSRRDYFVSTGR